jgi:hypothetical protein
MTSPTKPDQAKALSCIHAAKSLTGVMTPAAKWMAVGYLSEAEWKLAGLSIEVMGKVREARHGIEKKGTAPDWAALIAAVESLS